MAKGLLLPANIFSLLIDYQIVHDYIKPVLNNSLGILWRPTLCRTGPLMQTIRRYIVKVGRLSDTMPLNVYLLTFDQLGPKEYLVRVEHYFELNEDEVYSQPATTRSSNIIQKDCYDF